MEIVNAVKDFGFPIVSAIGLLYVIYYVWKKITTEIEAELEKTTGVLIGLIDRIRTLDNDIIRLQEKLDTAIEMKRLEEINDKPTKRKKVKQ